MPVKPPVFRLTPNRQGSPGRAPDPRESASRRGYGSNWRRLRKLVLARDCYLCQLCMQPAGKSAHVDHIIAKAKGGSDEMDNLRTLCERCHNRKTAREDRRYAGGT